MSGSQVEWRGGFENAEVNALHAEAFGHPITNDDWQTKLTGHSLGWVCGRMDGNLVGFVNVAWDGGPHAFVLDTMVRSSNRHEGVGVALIAEAVRGAKAAGCEWLHVDFPEDLRDFYHHACGFRPTAAGLIQL